MHCVGFQNKIYAQPSYVRGKFKPLTFSKSTLMENSAEWSQNRKKKKGGC